MGSRRLKVWGFNFAIRCRMRQLLCVLLLATAVSGCGVVSYSPPASEVCGHLQDTNDRAQCERQLAEASSRERAEGRGKAPGLLGLWASSATGLYFLWLGAYHLTGLVFAGYVYVDARKREWLAFRIGPFWWAAVCVFEPVMGALVYWTLHYSRLVRINRGP
jgi:hypothetical protein